MRARHRHAGRVVRLAGLGRAAGTTGFARVADATVLARAAGAALLVLAAVSASAQSAAHATGSEDALSLPLDSLAIRVTPDHAREFLYTDKGGAHFFGEAAHAASRSYHGFYSHMHEFVDGWDLEIDGRPQQRVMEAHVYPDRLERRFDDVVETVTLLDADPATGGAALLVSWTTRHGGRLRFAPRLDIRFLWEEVRPDYDVLWDAARGTLAAASRRHLERTRAEDWPVWIGMACSADWTYEPAPQYLPRTYPKGEARRAMARATPYRPGVFEATVVANRPLGVCFALADGAADAVARAQTALRDEGTRTAARRSRLQALVDRPGLASGDTRLARAAAWCRLGMDQLVMRQRGLGIYAGYPWFTTYWGRDTFIALPGACLVTGDFETARTILATFAVHQDRDPQSPRQGRLPNFVTVKEVQYATADGTWWWVRALAQYEAASGDAAFADSLYPVVKLALDGALAHKVDALGFVRHGDGETWMDAGGEAKPFSPRGDRAIEVQALFAQALRYGATLARRQREREDGLRWQAALERLTPAFEQHYFDPGTHAPHDHLNADGTADSQVRPNALLAWFVAPELFTPERALATVQQARDRLAYPWGVGSLAAGDPQFKAWHLALDRWYYDAAYHNGDVWLWLSGPLVRALVQHGEIDAAWRQTSFLVGEILERGVAGSLREIRDAADTPGKDEFGGACAQAWSLSELQRTLYEDYLGVQPDIPSGRLTVAPLLPAAVPSLSAVVPVGRGGWLRLACERDAAGQRLRLEAVEGCTGVTAHIVLTADDGRRRALDLALEAGRASTVTLDAAATLTLDGAPVAGVQQSDMPPRPAQAHRFQPPPVSPRP